MPEGHLVSAPPLCPPCSAPQGQAESGGMVLVAYAGPVRPAAALRDSVLCLPTDIHSLFVNKPSSSSSSGLTQRASWELLLLTGQGWMTCLSSPQTYPSWGRLPRGVDWGPPRHVGVRCSAEHGGNDEVPQGACMSHKTPTTPPCPRPQSLPAAV